MVHTPGSAAERATEIARLARAAGRDPAEVSITVMGEVAERADLDRWAEVGVDRLIVTPLAPFSGGGRRPTNLGRDGLGLTLAPPGLLPERGQVR